VRINNEEGSMAKIQIIDDDREAAENMALLLEKEGYTVALRDDTEGALDELARDKPDLLILDVMFPENPAGGFDLARKIRQRRELKDLPVILLTAVNQEFPLNFSAKDIDPAWMPVQDFLDKPVQFNQLLPKIKKLLKQASRTRPA
jgi:CheY-like chemotaxis protein